MVLDESVMSLRLALIVGLPASLLNQPHARDLNIMRQPLAHVVNRQCGDCRPGERFHFHASAVMHRYLTPHDDLATAPFLDFHRALVEAQWVAEGDQLVGTLSAHDAGDDGCVEYGALLRTVARLAKGGRDGRREADPGLRGGHAVGDLLAADVDHSRAVALVKMGE